MCLIHIYAKHKSIYIKAPLKNKIGEGVVSNEKENIDLEFNDMDKKINMK